jgi:hypothetical protein
MRQSTVANVRDGSIATFTVAGNRGSYTPNTGHSIATRQAPLRARKRHARRKIADHNTNRLNFSPLRRRFECLGRDKLLDAWPILEAIAAGVVVVGRRKVRDRLEARPCLDAVEPVGNARPVFPHPGEPEPVDALDVGRDLRRLACRSTPLAQGPRRLRLSDPWQSEYQQQRRGLPCRHHGNPCLGVAEGRCGQEILQTVPPTIVLTITGVCHHVARKFKLSQSPCFRFPRVPRDAQ